MPTLDDIEMAFEFVSGASDGSHRAVYSRTEDRFLYESDLAGESEIPEDIDPDDCVEVPDKQELDLGHDLVFRFVDSRLPGESARVRDIFRKRGAYSRFKALLERAGFLQAWYDTEASAMQEAIRDWCKENRIMIADGNASSRRAGEAQEARSRAPQG